MSDKVPRRGGVSERVPHRGGVSDKVPHRGGVSREKRLTMTQLVENYTLIEDALIISKQLDFI